MSQVGGHITGLCVDVKEASGLMTTESYLNNCVLFGCL